MRGLVPIALLYVVLSQAAWGQISTATYYPDRASFDIAHPTQSCEDFEGSTVAAGDVQTFPAPLNSSTNNGIFPAGSIVPGLELRIANGNGEIAVLGDGFFGSPTTTVGPNQFLDNLEITFSPARAAIGFDLFSFTGSNNITVDLYDSADNLIEQSVVAAQDTATFFGFSSTVEVGRIVFSIPEGDVGETVDNVCFANIDGRGVGGPVMGPIGLMLMSVVLGGLGFGASRRKRR